MDVEKILLKELYGIDVETADELNKMTRAWTYLFYMPREKYWGEFFDYMKNKYNIKGIDNWKLIWFMTMYRPAYSPAEVKATKKIVRRIAGVTPKLRKVKIWGGSNETCEKKD